MNMPIVPVDGTRIAQWEQMPYTDVMDAAWEIRRLQGRERELLEVNNRSLEKARGSEEECNQQYCETLLLRRECMRLREVASRLGGFIESCKAGEGIPAEIAQDLYALFPADPAKESTRACTVREA